MMQIQAFFVFCGRDNLLYKVVEKLLIKHEEVLFCLKNVTDEIIILRATRNETKFV